MRPLERILALVVALAAASVAQADDEPLLRYRAPIVIEQGAAFVKLALPAQAYARSAQAGLQDLRVVDARGERVPFALLAPRPDELQASEQLRDATLYPLPPRPSGPTVWASPVDVVVEGDRISVRRRAGVPASSANARSPGWLIDLGERKRDEPAPQSLRLQWSGPVEFSVAYTLELSDDLRGWRAGGGGQVMALASSAGALTQPNVPLPDAPARFVRLVWSDIAGAPSLSGAQSVTALQRNVMLDPPTELQVATSPEPAGKAPPDADARRALHFDLGAPLPIVELDLALAGATQVAPVRLQTRTRADEPWQALAGAVFYRLDREGATRRSPPLAVQRGARFVRVLPDERAGALDPATRLVVRVQLSSIVFAGQGEPPYALLAGSERAAAGALPLATLVPSPDEERARFGRARLGDWTEVTEAMRQAQAEQRRASLRPWLLWAVLLLGVASLAFMVWRLARGAAAPKTP
jgi:hypothetical protein